MKCVARVSVVNTEKSNLIGMLPEKDFWLTDINGPIEEVYKYYAIGKVFGMGYGHYDRNGKTHEDHLMKVESVFVLESGEKTEKFIEHLKTKCGQWTWDWGEHFCKEEYDEFCN